MFVRRVNHLNPTKNKKTFSDHSVHAVVPNAPHIWNVLRKSPKISKSVKHFRKQFKQKLILSYDYLIFSIVPCLLS